MKVNCNISVRRQLALLAFTLLYLLTVILHVDTEKAFSREFQNQKVAVKSNQYKQVENLVLTEAASVNASDAGIVSDKEFILLPVLFLLWFLITYPPQHVVIKTAPFFYLLRVYSFRIFPNAP